MFETEIYKAIKEKTLETPAKILAVIGSGKEDVNIKSDKNESYIHIISQEYLGDEDAPALVPVVFQLNNAGADVNATDFDGNNALHIAAKKDNARRLIRALIMIGVDPLAKNLEKKTPKKLAKHFPENEKILKFLSPGLWNAVEQNSEEDTHRLISNWCKVNEKRNGVSVSKLAETIGNSGIKKILSKQVKTIELVHYALAGDRKQMRSYFNTEDVNINTVSTSYIDEDSGEFVTLPLIGEVALLGLTTVVRKLLRKKASHIFFVKKTPLYLYIMQNMQPQDQFYNMMEVLLDKVDFIKNKRDTNEVLDAAYDKKLPISVLRTMATNGLDLFAADDEGHFLRDRILMKNASESPKKIEKEIAYVDNIVVDMASNGCVDLLQNLVERSYEYIDVTVEGGEAVRAGLTKSIGETKTEQFLKEADDVQKTFRQVCHVINIGHLAQVQSLLTGKVIKVKDRHGRSLAHRAVLFERRHVLRYLIKIKPGLATSTDEAGRSPLFMACALEEGDDMVSALKALGCKMDLKDQSGLSPDDVKQMSPKEKKSLLTKERRADYGMDTYLLFKYLDIKEAIRAGDLSRVEEIRGKIYKDILTKDISAKMYQTNPPQRDILQFAMDAKRDKIAKYLLTTGMEWDVKYKNGEEETSLLEAARRNNMQTVIGYIQYQMEKADEHKQLIKRLKSKGVVKNVKTSSTAANSKQEKADDSVAETGEDPETVGDSKTCALHKGRLLENGYEADLKSVLNCVLRGEGCEKEVPQRRNKLPYSSVIYLNGIIYTVDGEKWDANPKEAIVIEDGKIEFVGSNEEFDKEWEYFFISGLSIVYDLDGAVILPGLHDIHMHPLEAMSPLAGACKLPNLTPPDDTSFTKELTNCSKNRIGTEWVLGAGHSITPM
ncbi:uncharacterized protein LOC123526634 [Mercenaria mercenaria]|uniref:uncharacterized protein LOC123526634 n=1 Tax=Mercenaria mercenaria TaxID=6596 RepID=UPI00234EBC17|nr:uncharacterized protein LOC123526634 [Mercenaria mercenaria]